MANSCENTFYAYSEDYQNIKYIENFLKDNFAYVVIDKDINSLSAYFDSKWTFPEETMDKLYAGIPNKTTIYMRCLSVEYGCLYHALNIADEDGTWREV